MLRAQRPAFALTSMNALVGSMPTMRPFGAARLHAIKTDITRRLASTATAFDETDSSCNRQAMGIKQVASFSGGGIA
jgi:hypothetical protein